MSSYLSSTWGGQDQCKARVMGWKVDVSKGAKVLFLDEALVECIQYVPLRHHDRAVSGIYLTNLLKVAG